MLYRALYKHSFEHKSEFALPEVETPESEARKSQVREWPALSEKGEVLLRRVGTLRYVLILSENSACQVPIYAVAA